MRKSFKQILSNWVIIFIKKLSRFELWLNPESLDNEGYQDLTPTNTPTNNGEKDKTYSKAIAWALRNENIKNIALTGAYGSGKSSILRAFEKEHREYNYLNISLASFSDDPKELDEELYTLIEVSILQQIFYHVKPSQIPDSRFKRIISLGCGELLFKALGLFLWILALVVFFKPFFLADTIIWKPLVDSVPIVSWVSLTIIVTSFWVIIRKSIRAINNLRINKLNVKNVEMDICQGVNTSIMNKHLDELLYFFETTNYDVVILEDLDRFENTEIFTTLRELNILLNNSNQIKRRIVFIYAIKDDMFKDKNRTKFFDFILPVIPVINISNSGDMLHKMLITEKPNETVDETVDEAKNRLQPNIIDDVAMYIDDMRLLKNICNEYTVYKSKLNPKLNCNNLFAMIIYKNLHPSDFVDLHSGKGKVYEIFAKKPAMIEVKITEIINEVKRHREKIEQIEHVRVKNIRELRTIYIENLIEHLPSSISININGIEYSFASCKEDTVFAQLTTLTQINYYHSHYGQRAYKEGDISFSKLETIVDPKMRYKDREQLIIDKNNGETKSLKMKLEELNVQKDKIKHWTLQQIDNETEISIFTESVKEDKLIVYLIRNGYINEDYHDYLSYFHEGSITRDDNDFLLSVKSRESSSFEFKLTNIEKIIERIRPQEFGYKAVLNFSLVNHMLLNQGRYSEKWKATLSQICNGSVVSLDFIDRFMESQSTFNSLIVSVCEMRVGFWGCITNSDYPEGKKDDYLKSMIEFLDIDTIKAQDNNLQITKYLSKKADVMSVFQDNTKLQNILKELDIKFEKLEKPSSANSLFDFIYENNLYQINQEMIALFITEKSDSKGISDSLTTANYTTIKASACIPLIKYIDDNLNDYISNVFLKLPENTEETEENVVELLCKAEDSLTLEVRKQIIKKQTCRISNLSDLEEIEPELIELIVAQSKMTATWENVIFYFKLKEVIDDSLIAFLNQKYNYTELGKTKINKGLDETAKFVSISLALIKCPISDDSFGYLMRSIPYSYNSLTFDGLSNDKVNWMVSNKILNLTTSNFNSLKTLFAEKHIELLKKHPAEFMEVMIEYLLSADEYNQLLESSEFDQEQKTAIIQNIDSNLIIESRELSNTVCDFLKNSYIEVEFIVFKSLVEYKYPIDDKLQLLIHQLQRLTDEQITELLVILGTPYSEMTISGKRPLLPNSPLLFELLKKLKDRNYISSYKEKGDKINVVNKK